jgi:GxxExxY protein
VSLRELRGKNNQKIKGEIMEFDELSRKVIGCALEVHKQLGPGLLESAYKRCLSYELICAGLTHHHIERDLPIDYKGTKLDCGYRVDLLFENELIVELKAVDKLARIHEAQILTYMKLAKVKTGLLINFNVTRLKDGIKRFVL